MKCNRVKSLNKWKFSLYLQHKFYSIDGKSIDKMSSKRHFLKFGISNVITNFYGKVGGGDLGHIGYNLVCSIQFNSIFIHHRYIYL
jgi:hypothetical protein